MSITLEQRIAATEAALKQLRARRQLVEARQRNLENKKQRREDTRRKILVGAIVLNLVERGQFPQERLRQMLESSLTRADDRKLFGT